MRWGIAGYGDIVRRRALPALLSLSETVACVWGRDFDRARSLCDEYGIASATSDFTALLNSVDAVYVATPVVAHAPLAAAALRAGRHVLIEKPVRGALAPAATLPAAGDLRAGVAYYRRLAPAFLRLRELLGRRRVDRVAVSFRGAFDPAPDDPKYWRTDPALAGGGVLADAGSHRIDLLCRLLGEPGSVSATTARHFPQGAERSARMRLEWPSGTVADLEFAWDDTPARDHLSLSFDGGHLTLDPLDSGHITGTVDAAPVDTRLPPNENPHLPLMADFADSVRNMTEPVCPVEDALAVDRLIADAYTAASTQPVRRPNE